MGNTGCIPSMPENGVGLKINISWNSKQYSNQLLGMEQGTGLSVKNKR
jgi:hypothetical protein